MSPPFIHLLIISKTIIIHPLVSTRHLLLPQMQLLLDLLTHLLLPSFPLIVRLTRTLTRSLFQRRIRNTRTWRRRRGSRIMAYAREPAGRFRGLRFGGGVICVGGCGRGGGTCDVIVIVAVAAADGRVVAVAAFLVCCGCCGGIIVVDATRKCTVCGVVTGTAASCC